MNGGNGKRKEEKWRYWGKSKMEGIEEEVDDEEEGEGNLSIHPSSGENEGWLLEGVFRLQLI